LRATCSRLLFFSLSRSSSRSAPPQHRRSAGAKADLDNLAERPGSAAGGRRHFGASEGGGRHISAALQTGVGAALDYRVRRQPADEPAHAAPEHEPRAGAAAAAEVGRGAARAKWAGAAAPKQIELWNRHGPSQGEAW
jgi:hypothetical protein